VLVNVKQLSGERKIKMAEVFGCEVPDLEPELETPVDVLIVIKCLKDVNDTGSGDCAYRLVTRSSGISSWEAMGMCKWVEHIAFDPDLYEDDEEEIDDRPDG